MRLAIHLRMRKSESLEPLAQRRASHTEGMRESLAAVQIIERTTRSKQRYHLTSQSRAPTPIDANPKNPQQRAGAAE